ncbi:MAG TPA: hypothetical protein VM008_20135 [Phycisphaerae bacterium]|nr:hypothetical protein [Phycisphaerae bacterium]
MKPNTGKILDPVFLFMLVAVLLAVGSSFALRSLVAGLGPSSAQAADSLPDDATPGQALNFTSIPALPTPAHALASTNKPAPK